MALGAREYKSRCGENPEGKTAFYTLHQRVFTPNTLGTKQLLHQAAFTQNCSYTDTRHLLDKTTLHQTAFTPKSSYTKQLLHQAACSQETSTPTSFCQTDFRQKNATSVYTTHLRIQNRHHKPQPPKYKNTTKKTAGNTTFHFPDVALSQLVRSQPEVEELGT